MSNNLLGCYNPLPINLSHGKGCKLWDDDGNEYLDLLTGIAVNGLGHQHPDVTQAIVTQAQKLLHVSNVYQIKQQQELASLLCDNSDFDKVFFNSSGAEAVESAIKASRLYARSKNIENPKIVVFSGGFHGRTMGALSACYSSKIKQDFQPLVSGFVTAQHNDIASLQALTNDPDIVAVLIEPIQGEGGIRVPDENYLLQVEQICKENKWLFMVDEIQSGMGRTGKLFAHQHYNVSPDVMTLAKGLGNGIAIGACLFKQHVADLFTVGSHGTTFGGNPLSCATAIAVMKNITKPNLMQNVITQSQKIIASLKESLSGVKGVIDIRGKGLMMGVELDHPCRPILIEAAKEGLLFNITNGNTVRLLPPLIINDEEVAVLIEKLPQVIKNYLAKHQSEVS